MNRSIVRSAMVLCVFSSLLINWVFCVTTADCNSMTLSFDEGGRPTEQPGRATVPTAATLHTRPSTRLIPSTRWRPIFPARSLICLERTLSLRQTPTSKKTALSRLPSTR